MSPAAETPISISRSSAMIETTLYDLIEAINTEVGPDDDDMVVATVAHLLSTGQVKWRDARRTTVWN